MLLQGRPLAASQLWSALPRASLHCSPFPPAGVEHLDLTRCKLERLPVDALRAAPLLRTLHLAGNTDLVVTSEDVAALASLPRLELLVIFCGMLYWCNEHAALCMQQSVEVVPSGASLLGVLRLRLLFSGLHGAVRASLPCGAWEATAGHVPLHLTANSFEPFCACPVCECRTCGEPFCTLQKPHSWSACCRMLSCCWTASKCSGTVAGTMSPHCGRWRQTAGGRQLTASGALWPADRQPCRRLWRRSGCTCC